MKYLHSMYKICRFAPVGDKQIINNQAMGAPTPSSVSNKYGLARLTLYHALDKIGTHRRVEMYREN